MSWEQTHRYYTTLRAIEAQLDRTTDGVVAWEPSWAEVFGTPQGLDAALRLRWERLVQAQAETPEQLAGLAAAHPGLLRALHRAFETPRPGRERVLVGAA